MSKSMASLWTAALINRLAELFEAHSDPKRAVEMRRYMRNQFSYFGIDAKTRRELQRQALVGTPTPNEAELTRIAKACWRRKERDFQGFGVDYIRAYVGVCSEGFLHALESLITTKSWWDTVDFLATRGVGPLARRYPTVQDAMDEWIESKDIWLARTAILFQLTYKARTDPERLFGYCEQRAPDTEFFIRKAIGWALREYSKTDAQAVRRFVRNNEDTLSGLSKREALKWLNARSSSSEVDTAH